MLSCFIINIKSKYSWTVYHDSLIELDFFIMTLVMTEFQSIKLSECIQCIVTKRIISVL